MSHRGKEYTKTYHTIRQLNTDYIVFFSDSRGAGLQEILRSELDNDKIIVDVQSGGKSNTICSSVHQHLLLYPNDTVYLMCGVNNVCNRDPKTKINTFPWEDETRLYNHLAHEIIENVNMLRSNFLTSKIYLCTLIGLDLQINCHNTTEQDQIVLNNVVWRLNNEIHTFHTSVGLLTPWISREIHHFAKRKRKNNYYMLNQDDGIHYGEDLKWKVVRNLKLHITRTFNNHVVASATEIDYTRFSVSPYVKVMDD